MQLNQIQFLTGLFSLILVSISIYVGLYIASRYRKFNNKILLYVGLSWIGIVNGWWPSALNFVLIITTGNALSEIPYFFLGNALMHIFLIIWMIAITELLWKEKQKVILLIVVIWGVVFEIYFLYYLFTDYAVIGELESPVDVKYKGLVAIDLIAVLFTVCITGLFLARESLKSDNKETKLRGKFHAYAFIMYVIGGIADAVITLTLITLPIIRILLISCAITYYIGWIMPKFIKKIFLKQE
ncbi:MAG TPA: hypothetical protein VGB37_07225 [Candidatus Lokiarchaeia archaeon]